MGPTSLDDLFVIMCTVSNYFFAFVLIVAVAAFLYAALLFFQSPGGEGLVKGKKYLIYAAIGTAIAVLSKTIVLVIGNLMGVDGIDGLLCN